jgi:AAA domain
MELEQTLRSIPHLEKEQRDAVQALDRETAEFAVAQPFDQVKAQFRDLPSVLQHIEAMRIDLLENVRFFTSAEAAERGAIQAPMRLAGPFDRYESTSWLPRTIIREAPLSSTSSIRRSPTWWDGSSTSRSKALW